MSILNLGSISNMSDNKITHENNNNEGLRREDFEKLPSKGDWSYQLKH